jgi:hypothetical protein
MVILFYFIFKSYFDTGFDFDFDLVNFGVFNTLILFNEYMDLGGVQGGYIPP